VHERIDQFGGECDLADHLVEQHDTETEFLSLGGSEPEGGCTLNTNTTQISVRTPSGTPLSAEGDVEIRVQLDYVYGSIHYGGSPPDGCGNGYHNVVTIGWAELDSGANVISTDANAYLDADLAVCDEGSIDATVTIASTSAHYWRLVQAGDAWGFDVSNLLITVSDPGFTIPEDPVCEDDPDAFCDEPPTWPPEECQPPVSEAVRYATSCISHPIGAFSLSIAIRSSQAAAVPSPGANNSPSRSPIPANRSPNNPNRPSRISAAIPAIAASIRPKPQARNDAIYPSSSNSCPIVPNISHATSPTIPATSPRSSGG
jgi:hypothetical protein